MQTTLSTSRLNVRRLTFFVGLNTGYVTDREPDERCVRFYARRSSPALHCAIVGNVVIPGGHASNGNTPEISRSASWTYLARAIADQGTLAGIQLATAWDGFVASRGFRAKNTDETIRRARELVASLGSACISALLRALSDGAAMALDAGFRHLQVHAAHGYLFSLLVDSRIYDGAAEVLLLLSEWAQKHRGLGVETSIRISLRTGDGHFDSCNTEAFQNAIAQLPFDFVDVSSGFYNIDKQLIYPARPDTLGARRAETIAFAERFPQRAYILSGRALLLPEADLPENVHIGLCRDLLANPDFLVDPARRCVNSGKCHYYSRGRDHITCPQWRTAD
jgi:hypothetical protein